MRIMTIINTVYAAKYVYDKTWPGCKLLPENYGF